MTKTDKIPTDNLLGITASVIISGNKDKYIHTEVSRLSLSSMIELDREISSPADKLIVIRTLVGCCKLISAQRIDPRSIKAAAKKLPGKKIIAAMSILKQVYKEDKLNKYRPHEFVAKLPLEIRRMQPSDISEILSAMVHSRQLSKSKTDKSEQKKRGRMSSISRAESITGPKSYYESSKFISNVMRVFAKPSARKLVFWILIDSGLLWNYLYGMVLLELYRTKLHPPNKKLVEDVEHKENKTEVDNFIERLLHMDDTTMEKKAAKTTSTLFSLITDDHDLMLNLYIRGALNF